ncbi:hypothetical protein tinsulaeT_14240 [Thalassotalea insulae]|uniref:Spermidine synthase n=1 Tax=Thalassotalea insulae TaxID=2056778 RepID=A0ABQ6GSE2_9GAMM|nr:hypothetical protein [Thalassotalea insulae]GLX78084.1 hypothetical protein tinsulaeT_14240 [Thalassotalea insulae]
MKLDRHIQASKIIYLIKEQEEITIKESYHYRFLCFSDVVQSIMLKRKPARLTLPHQYFITLPLLFIQPEKIIEFGLGGGNLLKFTNQLLPQCQLTSVESSLQVIQCFQQYFNPEQINCSFQCQDASAWLSQQNGLDTDWLIFDIYQNNQNEMISLQLIHQLLQQLPLHAWLSINLVDLSETQLNKALSYLGKITSRRQMRYFIVPQYRNVIVHIYSQAHRPSRELSSLRPHQFTRWQQLWQYGKA